jgi:hypothetical protein
LLNETWVTDWIPNPVCTDGHGLNLMQEA